MSAPQNAILNSHISADVSLVCPRPDISDRGLVRCLWWLNRAPGHATTTSLTAGRLPEPVVKPMKGRFYSQPCILALLLAITRVVTIHTADAGPRA